MKPIISLRWLGLLLLILPAFQAKPTMQPSGSSENGTIITSTTADPTTTTSSRMTQEPQTKGKDTEMTPVQNQTPITKASSPTSFDAQGSTTKNTPTQKAPHSASTRRHGITKETHSANKNPSKNSDERSDGMIVLWLLVFVAVLILILVVSFRWATRQKNATGDAARRCSQGLQERLRSLVMAIEGCLGLSLWPRKRMENEEGGEDEEMTENNKEEGARKVKRCSQKGEDEDKVVVEEEEEEEDKREDGEDSSDDYSSLEGVDLRERGRQRQEEEDDSKEDDSKEERKREGAEEELTSVTLGEENKDEIEDNDLTML